MLEFSFWMLILVFSCVGVAEIIYFLRKLVFSDVIPENTLVVIQKNNLQDLETEIKNIAEQINFSCSIVVVDIGIPQTQKYLAQKITSQIGVDFIEKQELLNYLQK